MMREISMYIFDIFVYQIMYRDRSVSLNRIIRDIQRHFGNENLITDVLLRVPCVDTNEFGKYMVRIDEIALRYANIEGTFIHPIRYDSYCEDPEVDSVLTIVDDESCTSEPYICTTIGQRSITEHIIHIPSTVIPGELPQPFWMRVNLKQDSFKPKDRNTPVMYHKLSVAENFV